jgi:hypothetical protein
MAVQLFCEEFSRRLKTTEDSWNVSDYNYQTTHKGTAQPKEI